MKAIDTVRGREEYKRFRVNFGKDQCGNPPGQINTTQNQQNQQAGSHDGMQLPSPINGLQPTQSQTGPSVSPTGSAALGSAGNSSNGQYQGIQAPTPEHPQHRQQQSLDDVPPTSATEPAAPNAARAMELTAAAKQATSLCFTTSCFRQPPALAGSAAASGYGLAIQGDGGLPGWAEEVVAQ